MSSERMSAREWRELSDAEQRQMIREGMVDFEDLPDRLRIEVEEMLANSRPVPSSA